MIGDGCPKLGIDLASGFESCFINWSPCRVTHALTPCQTKSDTLAQRVSRPRNVGPDSTAVQPLFSRHSFQPPFPDPPPTSVHVRPRTPHNAATDRLPPAGDARRRRWNAWRGSSSWTTRWPRASPSSSTAARRTARSTACTRRVCLGCVCWVQRQKGVSPRCRDRCRCSSVVLGILCFCAPCSGAWNEGCWG